MHRSVAAHAGVIALAIVVVLWDAIAAQTLPGAPGVPSVSLNDNTVTIAWAAPTTGAAPSSYVIIAGTTSGIGNIGTFNVGPSRSITTLVRDGTYFIRIAGVNGAGQGPGSAEVSFTVGGGVAPGAPGTPVATVNGSSVTLSWTAPTTGGVPAYYLLTAGTTSGGRDLGTYSVGALTNITATMPSGTYFVRAIATNASGESMPSGEVAFTIAGGRSSPGALDGTWQGTTSQGVAVWFIVSNGVITRLNIGGLFNNGDCLASTDAGVVVPISIGPFAHTRAPAAGTLSWSMTGTFTANTTAMGYATMTASPSSTLACSGMVTVAWSARNYGVGAPLLPRTPIGFGASVNRNVVNFTWAAPATGDPPINEYLVEVRRPEAWPGEFPVDTVFTFAKSSMPCSPMCSAFVSSLAGRNTPYVARVRARNSSGTSAPSNEFTFTIPELPGAPRNLAVSVTAGTASFIWSAPASGGPPVSYDLEIGTASGLSDVAVRSATMTSYSLELSAGMYFARVRARNASGTGLPSNETSFLIILTGSGPFDGDWRVSSSPEWYGPLDFTVTNNAITILRVGSGCGVSWEGAVFAPISGGKFSHTRAGSAGTVSWSLQGTFTSTVTASGTATITFTWCSDSVVDVTWSATKVEPTLRIMSTRIVR